MAHRAAPTNAANVKKALANSKPSTHGKSALLAPKIWEEDINSKGGLLGCPVKLIFYDDQSSPSQVPGIYTKLLDADKVGLIIGA